MKGIMLEDLLIRFQARNNRLAPNLLDKILPSDNQDINDNRKV